MFSPQVQSALIAGAQRVQLEPACLLALVEAETNGQPFERDGRTPRMLFERHVCWREAAKASKRLQSAFASAGLAIPKWSRSTQYKDEGTSAGRLELIARARAIDAEIANLSASWGLGQTMGFLHAELGFDTATEMVAHMTGSVAGQIDCLLRELQNKHLIVALNRHDWPTVARIYNGPGYAANKYDTRLAEAWKRWCRKLGLQDNAYPAPNLSQDEIAGVQRQLAAKGLRVGLPNGDAGPHTVGAIAAVQAHNGLPVTGKLDDATRAAINEMEPLPPSKERERATAEDLKAAGSRTIRAADHVTLLGQIKSAIGALFTIGAGAEKTGLLDTAQGAVDKANQAKGLLQSIHELVQPALDNPAIIIAGVVLIVFGFGAWWAAEQVKAHRLADHKSGAHAGPSGE